MIKIRTVIRTFVPMCLLAGAMTVLAGCGDPEVAKGDVEKNAATVLSAKVGKESPPITCPSGLKAKVGAAITCSMVIDGKTYDVGVNVTSIDGTNAKFDVAVADKPRS